MAGREDIVEMFNNGLVFGCEERQRGGGGSLWSAGQIRSRVLLQGELHSQSGGRGSDPISGRMRPDSMRPSEDRIDDSPSYNGGFEGSSQW
jgi:hypothetical protein